MSKHLRIETDHRHYDAFMEGQLVGKTYKSRWKGVDTAKRRAHSRLGVANTQHLEPIGSTHFFASYLAPDITCCSV